MTEYQKNKNLFVIGPNPAWQVTLFFNGLRLGSVNRATDKKTFASGKGINFCRAAMTTKIKPVLFHFTGGHTGSLINDGVSAEQLQAHAINTQAESRRCITCLDRNGIDMTELIEPPGSVSNDECDELLQHLNDNLPACAGIALCGTVPPGAEHLYRQVAELARQHQLPLLVDACQHVEEFLGIGNIILKVNAEEIKAITGEQVITLAIKKAFDQFKLHRIAVTAGAECAYYYDGKTTYSYQLPIVAPIISSLGAGDTCSAIFACQLLEGAPPYLAFANGLAAASASCLTDRCAEFKVKKSAAILNEIIITKVTTNP